MNKNILVVCALGYATSSMMEKNIKEFLDSINKKDWKVEAVGLKSAKDYLHKTDIIITSVGLDQKDYDQPVINGIPLISGIRKKDALKKLQDAIEVLENEHNEK